jgi:hypothetical protein
MVEQICKFFLYTVAKLKRLRLTIPSWYCHQCIMAEENTKKVQQLHASCKKALLRLHSPVMRCKKAEEES